MIVAAGTLLDTTHYILCEWKDLSILFSKRVMARDISLVKTLSGYL